MVPRHAMPAQGDDSAIELSDAYDSAFSRRVLQGLMASPRRLPPSLFYDDDGARLFDEITDLPEYYATRTEQAILEKIAPELRATLGDDIELIEYGSGSSRKTEVLLEALDVRRYIPIDVSEWYLESSKERLTALFPDLVVEPLLADYGRPIEIDWADGTSRVAFFPGSTIGNMSPDDAVAFLRRARETLGAGGRLVLGADLLKDPAQLHAAYNDSAGVTAAFNRNILHHVNRIFDADFEPERWMHHALFDPKTQRIEMHLVADSAQTVHIAGRSIEFEPFETIWTESSHKYSEESLRELGAKAGLALESFWTDDERLFSVSSLRVVG